MKITEDEFFNTLDKINPMDYKVDASGTKNYFFYNQCEYILKSEIIKGKLVDNFYKFNMKGL